MRSLLLLPAAIAPLAAHEYLGFPEAMALAFPASGAVERYKAEPDQEQRAAVIARSGAKARASLGGIYVGHSGGRIDGVAFIDHVIGRTEHITWLLVLEPGGAVRRAEVMAYREPYGGEVRDRSFLAQFEGRTAADRLRVGREIANIAGATLSVHALADRLRFLLALHDIVLRPALPAWVAGRPSPTAPAGPPGAVERAGALGDVPLRVRIAGVGGDLDRTRRAAAAEAAIAAAAAVDRDLNAWRDDSAIAAANAAAGDERGVPLAGALAAAIALVDALHGPAAGAIDPTVLPVLRAWRDAARADRLPDPAALAAARAAVDWRRISAAGGRLRIPAGMAIDLSALRTGLALDLAAASLRLGGGEAALLDGGGSTWLAAGDPAASGADALFAIALRLPGIAAPPAAALRPGQALAVSSSDGRTFRIAGETRSHLIDPRTGASVPAGRAAAVIAATAAEADALATAACILDPDQALAAVAARGARALIVRDGAIAARSAGWPDR